MPMEIKNGAELLKREIEVGRVLPLGNSRDWRFWDDVSSWPPEGWEKILELKLMVLRDEQAEAVLAEKDTGE